MSSKRDKQVHCFVSPDEKDELTVLAEVRGLSVSAYLRSLYLQDRARYYGGDANHLSLLPSASVPEVHYDDLVTNHHDPVSADIITSLQNRSIAS